MISTFSFSNIPTIHFGQSKRLCFFEHCNYGKNLILVTGSQSFNNSKVGKDFHDRLIAEKFNVQRVLIGNEPTPEDIDTAVQRFNKNKADCVLAIGGGSVIDAGKAISAMLTVEGSVVDYLEGVGTKQHPGTKVPFIAMPSTSGTGSEATKNAVITKHGHGGFKKSLRHDNFVPNVAIIDPELMLSCPPSTTAAAGMDAFTQLVESYLSTNANPITDCLALDGISRVIRSLENAVNDGKNIGARTDLAYAALLSGITLANAGLGVVHGFAQPLGSLFPIPHGVVCGTLMAPANRVTLHSILKNERKTNAVAKYAKLGSMVLDKYGDEKFMANIFIEYLEKLTMRLKLPNISEYGVEEKHFKEIIENAGLKNHPVKLSDIELKQILGSRI